VSGAKLKILILGYGEMGHAMKHLLADRHDVRVWQRRPAESARTIDLETTAATADFVFFCVPAPPHAELASRLLPAMATETICLSIAKGLDDQGCTAAHVFQEVFQDKHRYGLLYGPMISEEIRAGRPAFAQLGARTDDIFTQTRELFRGTPLFIAHTEDITGISWSAVLKNVYAILFGIADELGLGDNTRGFLTVAATQEIDSIVMELGGRANTPFHLAGLGDLVTTATSEGSRHHELGRRLARGERVGIEGEGVHTLRTLHRKQVFNRDQFPLYRLVESCVLDANDVQKRFTDFLKIHLALELPHPVA